jgi:hypothetical protein
MKRLKKKRQGRGFERTFGIREYILYDGKLGIHLDVPADDVEEVSEALQRVQYFGTSDSICCCLEITRLEPGQRRTVKRCTQNSGLGEGVVFLLSNFTEKTTFEDINPFSGKKMKKDNLALQPYLFPIQIMQKDRIAQKDRNCTIYECI